MREGDGGTIFIFTCMLGMGCIIAYMNLSSVEITEVEFYRFCLHKEIPLDECLVPKKPHVEQTRTKE